MSNENLKKIESIFKKHQDTIQKLTSLIPQINEVASLIKKTVHSGGKVLIFGNGGSASDSQHIAAEIVGRFVKERKGLPAIALTTDTSIITAVANDYGYEHIFSRQIEALCLKNDVVIGISTSGNSKNVIKGLEKANTLGAVTIGLTGGDGGLIKKISLPLGVLRLFNQPKRNKDKINSIISFYLNKIEWLRKGKTKNLYLCGGTWRTLLNAHIYKTNYPLSILHQYKLPAIEALKFSNSLSSVKLIKSEKLVGVTKSRTNYIPIGSYILSSLIKICDPSSILCSVSGVREGSLINKAYLNILKKDSLNRSVHFIALKKGDFGENYIKLYNFLKKIFPNKDENFPIRLLLPACSLSNFDWGLGTYQRAELVFHEVINSPILKLSHNDRIKLGLVSFWRHCSTKYYPDLEFLKLLSPGNRLVNVPTRLL